ncbi:hypothetical protein BpHYR1_022719 [Brachionus plicatilis]|uniref:Uncharacterized protein n=1 Tax=Brachionus plicatilis TaxID=10195 RepID=A0A3M7T6Q4_BRAPC|nr:hypothetical protein BpHYR1_022719 [Brachionus plicatilis]
MNFKLIDIFPIKSLIHKKDRKFKKEQVIITNKEQFHCKKKTNFYLIKSIITSKNKSLLKIIKIKLTLNNNPVSLIEIYVLSIKLLKPCFNASLRAIKKITPWSNIGKSLNGCLLKSVVQNCHIADEH